MQIFVDCPFKLVVVASRGLYCWALGMERP